jgi:hypothetical protein
VKAWHILERESSMIRIGVGMILAFSVLAFFLTPAQAQQDRKRGLRHLMTRPVTYEGLDDPKAKLSEVLDELAKQYDVTFNVNERAFEAEGLKDVLNTPVVTDGKPLPKLKNVAFAKVVQKILTRVPVKSGAIYLVKTDSIEITTRRAALPDLCLDSSRRDLPLVHCEFDKLPLADALKEVADAADFEIILDARMAEGAKAPITASLDNVPVDTAVQLLADMADLKSVLIDNVLYVTLKENARTLEAENLKRKTAAQEKKAAEDKAAGEQKEAALLAEKRAKADEIRTKLKDLQAQLDKLQAEIDGPKKK